MANSLENVLVLQGGGSLGAFGCGVFKALVNNNIKLDIVAGKSILSFYCSAFYGNEKVFEPRWRLANYFKDPQYFSPYKWTYLYDHSPLIKTLEKYIDYNKLQPNGKPNSRLVMTAVNVLTSEPLVFDSNRQQITSKHLLATTAYPSYYFPWIEVEKGVYAWDGSLLSNTPFREMIEASPIKNKKVFLVENYPKSVENLPSNLQEVQHRARDIIFSDKTLHNIHMSKTMTYQLKLINDLYKMLKDHFKSDDKEELKKFENIYARYKKVSEDRGAEIKGVYYITRDEPFPSLYENADFSLNAIKGSIRDGEQKTNKVLKVIKSEKKKKRN